MLSRKRGTASRWRLAERPVWARGRCRISPPRFPAECCKRQLNQVSLVLLYFRLSAFSDLCWVCLSVFSCTVLFASTSHVIGCEDRLRNDLYCVGWGVKLYSNQMQTDNRALPAVQPTASKHWRQSFRNMMIILPVKIEWWGVRTILVMILYYLERRAKDLHIVQLMQLPPVISCFIKVHKVYFPGASLHSLSWEKGHKLRFL